ncbi:hypothetical protein EDD22DRAFT_900235, partial [Suillus occidentalis]
MTARRKLQCWMSLTWSLVGPYDCCGHFSCLSLQSNNWIPCVQIDFGTPNFSTGSNCTETGYRKSVTAFIIWTRRDGQ